MSLCVQCGQETPGADICPHHHVIVAADGWASSNRAMCNWIHRGELLKRLPEAERADETIEFRVDVTLPWTSTDC